MRQLPVAARCAAMAAPATAPATVLAMARIGVNFGPRALVARAESGDTAISISPCGARTSGSAKSAQRSHCCVPFFVVDAN